MKCRQGLLVAVLLACVPCVDAAAAPPTFAQRVSAIETATDAELARLEAELATTTDTARLLELQRCALWVKLSARLALHEAQRASAPADPEVSCALEELVADLRARLAEQAERLPADYAFEPLAALASEVASCVE